MRLVRLYARPMWASRCLIMVEFLNLYLCRRIAISRILSDKPNWKAIQINYFLKSVWGSMLFCWLHCLKKRCNLNLLTWRKTGKFPCFSPVFSPYRSEKLGSCGCLAKNGRLWKVDERRKIQKPALQRACGWGAGTRTPISSSRDCCPAIRRHPIVDGVIIAPSELLVKYFLKNCFLV